MTTMDKYQERHPEPVEDRRWASPRVDIHESDKELLLLADLPGVPEAGLSVNLDEDRLTIEGLVAPPVEGTPLTREFAGRDYRRVFVMPPGIDGARISATLAGGVLTLRLPRSEKLQPRQIEVKTG